MKIFSTVWWSVFLCMLHCILNADLSKYHSTMVSFDIVCFTHDFNQNYFKIAVTALSNVYPSRGKYKKISASLSLLNVILVDFSCF